LQGENGGEIGATSRRCSGEESKETVAWGRLEKRGGEKIQGRGEMAIEQVSIKEISETTAGRHSLK